MLGGGTVIHSQLYFGDGHDVFIYEGVGRESGDQKGFVG